MVTFKSPGMSSYKPPQTFHTSVMAYAHITTISQTLYPQPFHPTSPTMHATKSCQPNLSWNQNSSQTKPQNTQNQKQVEFDPIPMSYTELLPHLIQNGMVLPISMNPVGSPYPRGYDANAKCDYHVGVVLQLIC